MLLVLTLVLILVLMLFLMMHHDDIDPMFRAADSANETLPCKAMFHSHLYHSPPLPKPESYFCEPGGWRLDGHHQLHL